MREDNFDSVYQPHPITKTIATLSLVIAAFVMPIAVFTPSDTQGRSAIDSAIDAVDESVDSDTVIEEPGDASLIPPALLFANDAPAEANVALSVPPSSIWAPVSSTETKKVFSYEGCTITSEMVEHNFSSVGKDASSEALNHFVGRTMNSPSVTELSYNFVSTAEFVGAGYGSGSNYSWVFARALPTISKYVVVETNCDSQNKMYEVSDSVRRDFGFLLSP